MERFKIHFRLQDLEHVMLWGENPNWHIHWFGLTDGLLWITVGEKTIYEYSDAALQYFGTNVRYNDYQIVRFLEDFFGIFRYVGEPIPEELYLELEEYYGKLHAWKTKHDEDEDEDEEFDEFYFNEYCRLNQWHADRSFDSGHLVGGPYISCFRCGEKLKIMWESNYRLEDGNSIWTADKGSYEMYYDEFVAGVKKFFEEFTQSMDKQVEAAVKKEWEGVELNKQRLLEENEERKNSFFKDLTYLQETKVKTDWEDITKLYSKMEKELMTIP